MLIINASIKNSSLAARERAAGELVFVEDNDNVLRPTVRIMGGTGGEIIDLMGDFRFLTLSVTGLYSGDIDE